MPTRLIACSIALFFIFTGCIVALSQGAPPAGPPMVPPALPSDNDGPPTPPGGNRRPPKPNMGPPTGPPPRQLPRPDEKMPLPGEEGGGPNNATGNNLNAEIVPINPNLQGHNCTMLKGDPAHTGYFQERLQFPLKLSWKYLSEVCPDNPSSPAIKDGVIYFGAGTRFYAVNAETGTFRWCYPATESLTSTIRTSPVVGDGMVYFGAGDGRLYAVSTEDGSLVWSFVTKSNITSSPILLNDILYFGSDDRRLYALDAKTGAMRWPGGFVTQDGIASSPAIADGLAYFLSTDTVLYAANIASGRLSWATRIGSGSRHTTPIIADNTIYLAAGNDIYAMQSKSARVKWSATMPGEITTTPAVAKGIVYFAFKNGKACKLVALTSAGKVKWKEPVQLDAPSYSSPIVVDDTIIITGNKGLILAVDAETGQTKWKYTVMPSILEYGAQRYKYRYVNLVAAPVVANGTLYVLADDGALHAFSLDSPDTTAPRVETVRPLRNFLMPGAPPVEISAMVKDQGSGIREDTIKLTLDGEALEHHIIPERGVIWYKTPRSERLVPLSNGRHTATLTVEDWAGNKTYEEWTFMVDNTLKSIPKPSTNGGNPAAGEGPPPAGEGPPPGYR